MKRTIYWWFIGFMVIAGTAEAQVTFQKVNSWEELLSQAKKEDKMIFLDAYTDWCGWCKVMDKNTFSKKEVGDTMHQYFIPIKLEMEKSALGKQIAMKYSVRGFPSFLVFDYEGNMLKQWFGYQPPEDFLPKLSEWIHQTPHTILPGYSNSLNMKYHPEYLKLFARSDKEVTPDSSVVARFFISNDLYTTEENWVMAKTFYWWMPDETMNKLLNQKEKIIQQFGQENFEGLIEDFTGSKLNRLIQQKEEEVQNVSFELAELMSPLIDHHRRGTVLADYYHLNFYLETQQYEQVFDRVEGLKSKGEVFEIGFVNEICWEIYLNCEDKKVIQKAIEWMSGYYPEKMSYNELDTYASLHYKQSDYDNALKIAQEAIKVGEKENADIEGTLELLQKIENAQLPKK